MVDKGKAPPWTTFGGRYWPSLKEIWVAPVMAVAVSVVAISGDARHGGWGGEPYARLERAW